MKKRYTGPIISIVTILFCIVILELCLRLFAPVSDPYGMIKAEGGQYIVSQFPIHYRLHTQVEEGLPGMKGHSLFTTNNMGFRGDFLSMPKPSDEFRIFMLGGSSIESFYLDDSQSIHTVLQKELNKHISSDITVKVYNAAKSGDFSVDHISMIGHRIMHLEPDMIIICCGVNDLTRSIYNFNYSFYNQERRSQKKFSFWRLLKILSTEFQIPRRIYYLARKISPRSERQLLEEISSKSNYKRKIKLRKSAPISSNKPRTDLVAYRNNLETMIGICEAHGKKLILITQPTTWNSSVDPRINNWQWMLYRNGVTYRADLMDEAIESVNDVMRQVATEHSVPMYDLARSIPKSSEYFYDDAHFNVKGAYQSGTGLASFILESNLIPIPDLNK